MLLILVIILIHRRMSFMRLLKQINRIMEDSTIADLLESGRKMIVVKLK